MLRLTSKDINEYGEMSDWVNVDYSHGAATIVPKRAWVPQAPKQISGCPACTNEAKSRIPISSGQCDQERANCLQSVNRQIAQLSSAGYAVKLNAQTITNKCYDDYNRCIQNYKQGRVTFE